VTEVALSSQGRTFKVLHTPPAGRVDGPTVVLCPGRVGGPATVAWLVEPLLGKGLGVLAVEYSGGEERCFPRDVQDLAAAVAWLRDRGVGKIGLVGYSRGAIAVLNASGSGLRSSAIVAISPSTDQARLMYGLRMHAPESRRRLALRARVVEPEDDPLWYERISPIYKAAAISEPVLFVHGTNDLIAPIDHSWWMIKAMKDAGHRDVSLVEVPDAGHFFERRLEGYVLSEASRPVADWLADRLLAQPGNARVVKG
jgi:dipeptidyl aminopeptidase/acylaminoacyl peptidase